MERTELRTLPCVSPRKVHLKWSQSRYKMKKTGSFQTEAQFPIQLSLEATITFFQMLPKPTAFGSPPNPCLCLRKPQGKTCFEQHLQTSTGEEPSLCSEPSRARERNE